MFEKLRTYNSLSDTDKLKYEDMYNEIKSFNNLAYDEKFVFNDNVLEQFRAFKSNPLLHDQYFMYLPDYYGINVVKFFENYNDRSKGFYGSFIALVKENATVDMVDFLGNVIDNKYLWDDTYIVHVVGLNEFLDSGDTGSYGDFFEKNFEQISSLAYRLELNRYADTADLVKACKPGLFWNNTRDWSILLPVGGGEKEHLELVYSMNVDEVRKVLAKLCTRKYSSEYMSSKTNLPIKLGYILASIRDGLKIYSNNDVYKNLLMAFSKSYANSTPSEVPAKPTAVLNALVESMHNISMTSNLHHLTKAYVYTGRVYKISEFLVEYSDYFSGVEISAIIYSFGRRSSFSRNGTQDDYIKLIEEIIEKFSIDETIEFFRIIADVVLTYDGNLPTIKEWQKSFNDGIDTLGGDVAAELAISTRAYNKERQTTEALNTFRRATL